MEETGHQYSAQFIWKADEQTIKNMQGFYTEEMLADWSTYDSKGAEQYRQAVDTKEMNAVVFGMDGIPLETVTQEQYLMDGTFDAEAFAGERYILAVGVGIRAMIEGGFTTFRFTLFPLVICTPVLIVFAVLIPYLCFKNLEKRSIVERLRME